MSYVNLFIVKDDCVYFVSVHYRTAMKLLGGGIDRALPLLKSKFLDAGYLVIDANKKIIINGQSAFSIAKAIGKQKLEVFEV